MKHLHIPCRSPVQSHFQQVGFSLLCPRKVKHASQCISSRSPAAYSASSLPVTQQERSTKWCQAHLKGNTLPHLSSQEVSGHTSTRRGILIAALVSSVPAFATRHAAAKDDSQAILKAFTKALSVSGDFEEMDRAWFEVIEQFPKNSAAWSNRGTVRLQFGKWAPAYEDLSKACELEQQQGSVSSVLLNNLGNTEGALDKWESALVHYKQAAEDPEMEAIALANYALASFQVGHEEEAVRSARQLLRRDPEFLDMRCALVGFLWAGGERGAAETEWEGLQQAEDGLGGALYNRNSAVARVQNRWPPRATAALLAFLSLSDSASVQGYDFNMHTYTFAAG